MTGPLDVVIALLCLAFVLVLVALAIHTDRVEARNRRRRRVFQLEEIGILASAVYVPQEQNRHRHYCYQQKVEGLRSKGPRGWVTP